MPRIQVAKTSSTKKNDIRELYATVCYHYGYKLKYVSELPARDVKLLLKVARKIQAERMLELTQIVAAPHTEKGKAVKSLTEHFKGVING